MEATSCPWTDQSPYTPRLFQETWGQWVGIEHWTIASVREDLGLRLHANVVGDKGKQSFIYKPSARLIDAFNASMVQYCVIVPLM